MRWRVPTAVAVLGLCLGAPTVSSAMDLRDLPQWVRDMIEPVQIDWLRLAPAGSEPSVAPIAAAQVPGTVAAAGEEAATVHAPDLSAVEPVHLGGPGLGAAEPGEVHLGTIEALPGLQPVHVRDLRQEMEVTLGDLRGTSPEAVAKGGLCLITLEEHGLSEEDFVQWAIEKDISVEDMTCALGILGIDTLWRDPQNGALTALGAGLVARLGEDRDALTILPPVVRVLVALYLARHGRADKAGDILDSISQAELRHLPEALRFSMPRQMQELAPELALDIIERHAQLRPTLRRQLCFDLVHATRELKDTEIVRSRVIPFAHQALEDMPPTDFWASALSVLITANRLLGDHAAVLEEVPRWLKVVEDMGVTAQKRAAPGFEIAMSLSLLELGRVGEAAEMLCGLLRRSAPESAQSYRARIMLLELARDHPGLGPFEELPARLDRVRPQSISIPCDSGETFATRVELRGTTLLEVTRATCDLDFAEVTILPSTVHGVFRTHPVRVAFGPTMPNGRHKGTLVIETNDPQHPRAEIPVSLEVRGPIQVHPMTTFDLAQFPPDQQVKLRINLTGRVAFEVTQIKVDRPELVAVQATRLEDNRWLLMAYFPPPAQLGAVEGTIRVETDCEFQPSVTLMYHANTPDPQAGN